MLKKQKNPWAKCFKEKAGVPEKCKKIREKSKIEGERAEFDAANRAKTGGLRPKAAGQTVAQ